MEEIEKIITGFEDYSISNLGFVYSYKKERIRLKYKVVGKPNMQYYAVKLCNKGKYRTAKIHRLLGEYFIVKSNELQNVINHIDGNKLNNSISNLEWCTHGENIRHSIRILGSKVIESTRARFSKAVLCTITGRKYSSAKACAIENGLVPRSLNKRLCGITKNDTSFIYINQYPWKEH